jgi:hypothetical protein
MTRAKAITEDLGEARRILLAARAEEGMAGLDPQPLADLLYQRWFHGAATNSVCIYPHAGAYRAAAVAEAGLEPGWTVTAILPDAAPGTISASRGAEHRLVQPPAYAPVAGSRLTVRSGDAVRVSPVVEALHGGFWHVWSSGWRALLPEALRRLYFNVTPGAELGFVRTCVARAPDTESWALKILAGPHEEGRRDVAVFYFDRQADLDAAWVVALRAAVEPHLSPGTPPLAAPLAAGIAWADDPGGGVSFGQVRCRLLAWAATEAPEALASADAWLAAVEHRFSEAGLSLQSPERAAQDLARGPARAG